MASFPSTLVGLSNPSASDKLNSPSHSTQHTSVNDEIEAIEAKVGVDASAVTTSHDYKLSGVTGTTKALAISAANVVTNSALVIEAVGAADGFFKVQSGSTGDRSDFQLQAKGGSNANDTFIFSLRTDQPDMTMSVYDDSATTYHQILEFDYLSDLVKYGSNTILHTFGAYNTPSLANPIVLQHKDSSDNVGTSNIGIIFEIDADDWDGSADKHARIFGERASNFANNVALVASTYSGGALRERLRIDETITSQVAFNVDTINEDTAAAGVTIDGFLIKDAAITNPTINYTTVRFATAQRTADIDHASSSWANFDTALDLTLPARAGDVIQVSVSGAISNNAIESYLDVICTADSTSFSGADGASGQGIVAWRGLASVFTQVGAPFLKKLAAGQISGGNVVLRLRTRQTTATTKTYFGNANYPFVFQATNLGQSG